MKDISLLIYGASAAGIGLLDARRAHALVLERTAQVAREFIGAFHPGQHWEKVLLSDAAQQLRDDLTQRNLLAANDAVHLPAMAPVLFNFIQQRDLKVRLMTRIVDVKKSNDGLEVTYYDVNGLHTIQAQHFIDTTSSCESCPSLAPQVRAKKLNAMLHLTNYSEQDELILPQLENENITLVQGRFPGEVILKLAVDVNDDWTAARHQMHQFWLHRPAALQAWTLAAVADCFEIDVNPGPLQIAENWHWLPSCAYKNLLDAFDVGHKLGEGGDENATF